MNIRNSYLIKHHMLTAHCQCPFPVLTCLIHIRFTEREPEVKRAETSIQASKSWQSGSRAHDLNYHPAPRAKQQAALPRQFLTPECPKYLKKLIVEEYNRGEQRYLLAQQWPICHKTGVIPHPVPMEDLSREPHPCFS